MWAAVLKKLESLYSLQLKEGEKMLFTLETHISLVLHKGRYSYLKVNFHEKKSRIRDVHIIIVDKRKLVNITFNSV